MKRSYRGVVRASRAGPECTCPVIGLVRHRRRHPLGVTAWPTGSRQAVPSASDQSATNGVDHRFETVVRAELLIHVVEVIAKGLR